MSSPAKVNGLIPIIYHKVSTFAANAKKSVLNNLTISDEKIAKFQKMARKVRDFIIENKSLVFFALSVAFSYYTAPAASFEYLHSLGYSLKEIFIQGALIGTAALSLKNLFFSKSLSKVQDDKIHYLSGVANIGQTYLSPTVGLVFAVATSGFMLIKTAVKNIFPADETRVYMLFDQK
ncbi:MAG: hypothetical protein K940chlam1_00230 [Candidatus Anoxychlamydiales bacterium]|nr:hypothetical protein [Candidatus Anoxychlamydiales bacterium]NGX35656.1 hypothetical protein [Candidatus Anoxychlamydiales bacterium]